MRWFRSYSAFWLYTLLRFALFFALWGIVWLAGVPAVIGGFIAMAVSVPLSWVLLAKPRQAFAASLESRVDQRRAKAQDLDTRLAGTTADAGGSDVDLPPGVSEAPARDRIDPLSEGKPHG